MNPLKDREKFKTFCILLDSRCSAMIPTLRLITTLNPKRGTVIKLHTQAGNITINIKFKIDFTCLELIPTKNYNAEL